MEELNDKKLQKLLQLKKLETPGKAYFDAFPAEFQRYQRAQLLNHNSRWEAMQARLRELFIWQPRRALAVCGSLAAVVIMLTVGVVMMNGNLDQHGTGTFAKANRTPGSNVQLVSDTGAAEKNPTPRYATGQTSLSYDKAIAF